MSKSILENMKQYEEKMQDEIKKKLSRGDVLNDEELKSYQLEDEDVAMLDVLAKVQDGVKVPGFELTDFLASPQAKVLIPKVIIGAARKAADPVYLASKFFKKIKLTSGQAIMFPEFGVMRAYDVAEGAEIPQETIDWQVSTNNLIKVGKSGLRIQYSDELFKDTEFDIVSMLVSEAGRAMARHKEQKAFTEWLAHGWTVFDNNLRKIDPVKYANAGTTGLDFAGNMNDTMSIDDYLDIIIACYNNGYTPTDLVLHPLSWSAFAKNGFTGGLTAPYDRESKRETPNGSFQIGPESIQGRLPFSLNVNLSPFAPIDKENKTFDMFCVDANNVGVQIVKDEIKTESFVDPSRDITNIKLIERYGFGILHEGRAICSAKNISMAKSFPTPERSIILK
jgi:hypothetical protein